MENNKPKLDESYTDSFKNSNEVLQHLLENTKISQNTAVIFYPLRDILKGDHISYGIMNSFEVTEFATYSILTKDGKFHPILIPTPNETRQEYDVSELFITNNGEINEDILAVFEYRHDPSTETPYVMNIFSDQESL